MVHFDIWQNQYNIVKFKNKIKLKKKTCAREFKVMLFIRAKNSKQRNWVFITYSWGKNAGRPSSMFSFSATAGLGAPNNSVAKLWAALVRW